MDFGEDTELTVLKQNLQMPQTNANDEYLKVLLEQAASLMTREGIVDDDSFDQCAGHGMSSVGDKPTTGSYRQVQWTTSR